VASFDRTSPAPAPAPNPSHPGSREELEQELVALRSRLTELEGRDQVLQERVAGRSHQRSPFHTHSDAIGDALLIHAQDGRLLEANRVACNRLRYRRDDLLSMSLSDIDASHRGDIVSCINRDISQTGRSLLETVFRRRDDTIMPVELWAEPESHEGRPVVFTTVRDLSPERAGDTPITTTRTKHADPASALARFATGMSAIAPDRTILWASDKLRTMFPGREPVGSTCHLFFTASQAPCTICRAAEVFITGAVNSADRYSPVDHNWYHIVFQPLRDAEGRIRCVLEAKTVLSGSQRAEILIRAGTYSRNLLEVSLDPLVTISPEGTIWDVNAATESATGLSRDELIGTDFCDYFTDPDRARTGYRTVIADGSVRDYELVLRNRNGRTRDVLYNATLYRDEEGHIVGVFAAARDITERKKTEEAMKRYNEALEEAVRERTDQVLDLERQRSAIESLAATGRMAARVAHEINNPLAGIKNSFQLVKSAVPPEHQYTRFVSMIEGEIDRIARIVRQMFCLYKPQSEVPQEMSVGETVRDVILLLAPSCGRHRVFIQCAPTDEPILMVQPENSFRQVLFNVLQNAIEASPADGTITVVASSTDGVVQVTIRDQGPGIPRELKHRIFEPFFSTKGAAESSGMGIGLSISRTLVESMGGTLDFECPEGAGTLFRIRLPLRYPPKAGPDG
jgi:two-component system sporulation sensor kinase C